MIVRSTVRSPGLPWISWLTDLERLALRWVQKYIFAFSGDTEKVMMCASFSVVLQMQTNGGDTAGLLSAIFIESAGPLPTIYVDNVYLQATYNQIVVDYECAGANATDTLACLRTVLAEVLKAVMDKTLSFVSYQVSWWYKALSIAIGQSVGSQCIEHCWRRLSRTNHTS